MGETSPEAAMRARRRFASLRVDVERAMGVDTRVYVPRVRTRGGRIDRADATATDGCAIDSGRRISS